MNEQARRHIPPNRVRQPTGCSFVLGCSPLRLAATQLPLTTQGVTSYGMDFHLANKASSRTHSFRHGSPEPSGRNYAAPNEAPPQTDEA